MQFYASRAHATSASQGRFEPCSGLAQRTDQDYLLIPHKELSPSLHERDPVRRVSALSFQEQLELLFQGVALFDRYRIILSVHKRDFEVHANGH